MHTQTARVCYCIQCTDRKFNFPDISGKIGINLRATQLTTLVVAFCLDKRTPIGPTMIRHVLIASF